MALEPSERLLTLEAEHILATGDATGGARGQVGGPSPGEIITVLKDSAGSWHVGTPGEPDTYGDGMSLYSFGDGIQAFWLRLTPPLTAPPAAAEIVVTGPATQVRATVS